MDSQGRGFHGDNTRPRWWEKLDGFIGWLIWLDWQGMVMNRKNLVHVRVPIYFKYAVISRPRDEKSSVSFIKISKLGLTLNKRPIDLITHKLFSYLMTFAEYDSGRLEAILRDRLAYAEMPHGGFKDGYFWLIPPDIWAIQNSYNGYTLMFPEEY